MSPVIPLLRQHRVFYTLLAGMSLGLMATGWLGYQAHEDMRAAQRSLAIKQQEWQAMKRILIPASEDVAARAERRLASEQTLARLQNILRLDSPEATRLRTASLPLERTEAFFDLALMAEQLRKLAAQHGVALKPDERFGFAAYANGGPDAALIPMVYRQRQLAQYLVEQLIAVRPTGLLALQRERPGMAMPDRSEAAAAMQDYFTLDSRISVRSSGHVNSQALRVIFTGHTPVLRAFLNRLAGSELPLLVRAVEVEPLMNPDSRPQTPLVVNAAERPFVGRKPSKFTVTVEFIEAPPSGGSST
jgi:hypothetical protein